MSLPIEEWRPVLGYPGYYVSDQGNVRSTRRRTPVILRPVRKKRHGYLSVNLSNGGKVQTRTVHSLVAEAFIGPRPAGLHVLHGDGNQLNNRATNLRWGTRSENMQDAIRHGTLRRAPEGERICIHGHVKTLRPSGLYRCRTCAIESRKRSRQRRMSQAA